MKKILILAAVIAALLAGFAWQQGWLGRSYETEGWNVVLISIDSLRQDRLGAFGHKPDYAPEVPVSPNLDALAADGVVFDDAWTTTSWTLPAHMALMTGLTDRGHGVVMDDFTLDPLRRTVAQEFQDAGYATGGFYSGPYLDPKYGFGRGFDRYESAMSVDRLEESVRRENERRAAAGQPALEAHEVAGVFDWQSHKEVTSPRVNELARTFIDEHAARHSFFLFLHYFDVHFDYAPPPELAELFDPSYRGSMTGQNWYNPQNPRVVDWETRQRFVNQRDLGHVMALYDAEIHWVDRHIGAVVSWLKEAGVWDRTIVMVVSDHGDEFFEHGWIGHRETLYQEVTQIPMFLRVPGAFPRGSRVPGLVRIYDVPATLLDYAGLAALAESQGVSLRGAVEGGAAPGSVMQRVAFYGPGPNANIRDAWRDGSYHVHRRMLPEEAPAGSEERPLRLPVNPQTGRPWSDVFSRERGRVEIAPLPPGDPRVRAAMEAFCEDYRRDEEAFRALRHSPLDFLYAPSKTAAEEAVLDQLGYANAGGGQHVGQFERERNLPLGPFPPPCPE